MSPRPEGGLEGGCGKGEVPAGPGPGTRVLWGLREPRLRGRAGGEQERESPKMGKTEAPSGPAAPGGEGGGEGSPEQLGPQPTVPDLRLHVS